MLLLSRLIWYDIYKAIDHTYKIFEGYGLSIKSVVIFSPVGISIGGYQSSFSGAADDFRGRWPENGRAHD